MWLLPHFSPAVTKRKLKVLESNSILAMMLFTFQCLQDGYDRFHRWDLAAAREYENPKIRWNDFMGWLCFTSSSKNKIPNQHNYKALMRSSIRVSACVANVDLHVFCKCCSDVHKMLNQLLFFVSFFLFWKPCTHVQRGSHWALFGSNLTYKWGKSVYVHQ